MSFGIVRRRRTGSAAAEGNSRTIGGSRLGGGDKARSSMWSTSSAPEIRPELRRATPAVEMIEEPAGRRDKTLEPAEAREYGRHAAHAQNTTRDLKPKSVGQVAKL